MMDPRPLIEIEGGMLVQFELANLNKPDNSFELEVVTRSSLDFVNAAEMPDINSPPAPSMAEDKFVQIGLSTDQLFAKSSEKN